MEVVGFDGTSTKDTPSFLNENKFIYWNSKMTSQEFSTDWGADTVTDSSGGTGFKVENYKQHV